MTKAPSPDADPERALGALRAVVAKETPARTGLPATVARRA